MNKKGKIQMTKARNVLMTKERKATPSVITRRSVIFLLVVFILNFLCAPTQSQTEKGKKITIDKQVWASPYKSQGSGGSCSIHSVISFIESEVYRSHKKKLELSQHHCYYHAYIEKMQRSLRRRDSNSFRKGGQFGDALMVIEKYGAMPYAAYEATLQKEKINNFKDLFNELRRFGTQLGKKAQNNELNITWDKGVVTNPWLEDAKVILDEHMGAFPQKFSYEGKEYSPKQFAESFINLDFDDFVKLTSYSYIPRYQPGELLVLDNWLHAQDYYILPIDEFIQAIDHAITNGYSVVVDIHTTREILSDPDKNYVDFNEDKIVDQDTRDELFDNWQTSDVHLFHLIGIGRDESGKKYYLIKDSVGEELGAFPPDFYSENYFRARALAVMMHKNGIPEDIQKKLGF
jgi:bleomycin hydrolase